MTNPCLNCSAKDFCKIEDVEGDECPFDPTDKQLGIICDSDYSVRNVDTMKGASDIIEKIMED